MENSNSVLKTTKCEKLLLSTEKSYQVLKTQECFNVENTDLVSKTIKCVIMENSSSMWNFNMKNCRFQIFLLILNWCLKDSIIT